MFVRLVLFCFVTDNTGFQFKSCYNVVHHIVVKRNEKFWMTSANRNQLFDEILEIYHISQSLSLSFNNNYWFLFPPINLFWHVFTVNRYKSWWNYTKKIISSFKFFSYKDYGPECAFQTTLNQRDLTRMSTKKIMFIACDECYCDWIIN